MSKLPFLVVHGWWISWALVLACGFAGWLARRSLGRFVLGPVSQGSGHSRFPRGTSLAVNLFVFSIVGYLCLSCAGGKLLKLDAPSSGATLSSFNPAVIAAALPGSRPDALAKVGTFLDNGVRRTIETVEQRIELAELVNGCSGEVSQLLEERMYERAIKTARSCGSSFPLVNALTSSGLYIEAATIVESSGASPWLQVRTLIATSHWQEAAAVVDRLSLWNSLEGRVGGAQKLQCLAELYRHHGGDQKAARRLRDHAARNNSAACEMYASLALPPGESLVAIGKVYDRVTRADQHVLSVAAWSLGAYELNSGSATSQLTGAPPYPNTLTAWFAPYAVRARPSPDSLAWATVLAVYRGKFQEAASWVKASAAQSERRMFQVQGLDLAVQLRVGSRQFEPGRYDEVLGMEDELAISRGLPSSVGGEFFSPGAGDCPNARRAIDTAASAGDATQLVEVLETCRLSPTSVTLLLAVLPRIGQKSRRLAHALQQVVSFHNSDRELDDVAFELSLRRDLARGAGDAETARQFQLVIDRHLDSFDSHAKLVAYIAWIAA